MSKQKKSWVWQHFVSLPSGDVVSCQHCEKRLTYQGSTTSHLSKHLMNVHGLSRNEGKRKLEQKTILPFVEKLSPLEEANINSALVEWIAKAQRPLSIVDDDGFAAFIKKLNPKYCLPSRQTVKSLVQQKFLQVKDNVCQFWSFIQYIFLLFLKLFCLSIVNGYREKRV
jgi:hypothetical protein